MPLPRIAIRVAFAALLSMGATAAALAHEVQPAVSDVEMSADRVTITVRTAIEPILAGVDLMAHEDTDESPVSDRVDALRELPPDALAAELEAAWPGIAERITLRAGETDLVPELAGVTVPPVGDVETRRDTTLTLAARLPDDGTPVIFGWDAALGGLIVRQGSGDDAYNAFLSGGGVTDPMPRAGAATRDLGTVIVTYAVSGFDHIVPRGLDHILFVLGLFFYSLAFRPLIWQVSAFTVAHTATLALATLGIVQPTMWIVEALIALSIVWVAVENIWAGGRKTIGWGRIAVVFGFGLLHGLGFASVLSEFGLGQYFVASLISFNIGVEIGQLTVIAAGFLLLGLPFGSKPWYRRAVAIPGSVVIAAIASYWVVNRIGWVGDVPYLA